MPSALVLGGDDAAFGWAARARLMGWSVCAPGLQEAADGIFARGSRALPGLFDSPLPPPGPAVAGLPGPPDLMIATGPTDASDLDRVLAGCPERTCAAVTSGDLQARHPDRLAFWQAAEPVFLMPEVFVSGPDRARAQSLPVLAELGCCPGHEGPPAAPTLPGETAEARDGALVAMLRGLKLMNLGAGAHLNAMDRRLEVEPGPDRAALVTSRRAVPLDWLDYNGHMTEARYLHAFGDATDRFMELIGCDPDYIATGGSFFTAETHIRHLDEMNAGDRFETRTLCLSAAGKRMHLWHEMWAGDRLTATGEHILIHVDLQTRRPAPPGPRLSRLSEIAAAHAALPRPEGVGRYVGAPR